MCYGRPEQTRYRAALGDTSGITFSLLAASYEVLKSWY